MHSKLQNKNKFGCLTLGMICW